MNRPRLLDLFCCQGGAAMGYYRAGFDVIGVDIEPQPNYPFEFIQGDWEEALHDLWLSVDAIHASPPCQGYLNLTRQNAAMGRANNHQELIVRVSEALRLLNGFPYVLENVGDARRHMINPVRICGTSFDLPLRRHRYFESNVPIVGTDCAHHKFTEPKYWTGWRPNGEHRLSTVVQVYGNAGGREHWPTAMGIHWMDNHGLIEAVPPAYTHHIGRQLMAAVMERAA